MTPLRLDRFATLYVVHPMLEWTSATQRARIAVLMYHSISDGDRHHGHPYYETRTTPKVFEEHMSFLHRHRCRVTGLAEAVAQTAGDKPPFETTVVITFDDGFRDFYTQAFPILTKYGFPATVFLPTAFIDRAARTFRGMECLTWSEVRELHAAGVVFGSHTVNHPQLTDIPEAEVTSEVWRSKEVIEHEVGAPVDSFAYPYAFPEHDRQFRRRLRVDLERAGYQYGVTTIVGTVGVGDDRYFLKRLPVNGSDDMQLFRAKLEGGYDWLHGFQYAAKVVKATMR
jgi:peptidoglycan/xylan/chitin deacetylase (PgdA/CDA1 family)